MTDMNMVSDITLLSKFTLVMVFCWSPECFTSRAINRTKASNVWKHLARTFKRNILKWTHF